MAKRKSNNKNTKLILVAAALVLAVLGVILFFTTNAVQFTLDGKVIDDATFKGSQVVFGYTHSKTILGVTTSVPVLKFSFMALIPSLLVLVGAVFALLGLNNKTFSFVGGALLVLSAVLFMVVPNFVLLTEEGEKLFAGLANLTNIKHGFKALTGVYLAASCAGLGGLLTVGSAF